MARELSEVGELVAKIYDRVELQFPGCEVIDALIIVEVDTKERVLVEDGTEEGREYTPTVVMLEATADRLVVQAGMIDFAHKTLYRASYLDDDDD